MAFEENQLAFAGLPTSRPPARRVTFDEAFNRVHYVFGSNVYDRSYSREDDNYALGGQSNNCIMLGI